MGRIHDSRLSDHTSLTSWSSDTQGKFFWSGLCFGSTFWIRLSKHNSRRCRKLILSLTGSRSKASRGQVRKSRPPKRPSSSPAKPIPTDQVSDSLLHSTDTTTTPTKSHPLSTTMASSSSTPLSCQLEHPAETVSVTSSIREGSVAAGSSASSTTTTTVTSSTSTSFERRTSTDGSRGIEENCHFAFSAELRMVDSLVSILAQNRQSSKGKASDR